MRIRANQAGTQGSVLLVTLLTAWIIGISLVSYLTLVVNQNRSTYRSLTWNTCVPVMEAGIEEALTQLHFNGVTNLAANGWTLGIEGLYRKSRDVGADGSYFEVTIQPVDPPVIISTGYAAAPANTGKPIGGSSAFGMILGSVSGYRSSSAVMINRKVQVTTKKQTDAAGGLMAKGEIKFEGNASLDSFDSSNPSYSTDGLYDPAKRRDKAMALSNSRTPDAIQMASSVIYGSATTGPGGSVSIAGGTIGDAAWVAAAQTGVQTGHFESDANVQFDNVPEPFTFASGLTPLADLVGGTNYGFVVNGTLQQNFNLPAATIDSDHPMIIIGNATLYISGNLDVSSGGYIYLDLGASVKLYVGGSVDIGGNGIINGTSRAKDLSIYGLNTCNSINYSGSSPLIGTVYAPYAAFSFSGAAGAFGSFSANSISINNNSHVAFDESLNATGEYIVASWNEL